MKSNRGIIRYLYILCAITVCFYVGCASTQEVVVLKGNLDFQKRQIKDLKKEMEVLRADIQTSILSQEVESQSESQDMRKQMANIQTMVDLSHNENIELSARLEDYHDLIEIKIEKFNHVKTHIEHLGYRISNLEQQMEEITKGIDNSRGSIKNDSLNKNKKFIDLTTNSQGEELYQSAYQEFIDQDYIDAKKKFSLFLEKFSNSKLADNAQFWIGECEFKMGNYEQAIIDYERVKTDYPEGNKVPSAILKQGMAFLKLNRKTDAKAIFIQLKEDYPNTDEAQNAIKQLDKLN